MTLLILGLAIFVGLHLMPFYARGVRKSLMTKVGAKPYRGIFALALLGGIYLIVQGWKAVEIDIWYTPQMWAYQIMPWLVLIAFILFVASGAPTNIKRFIRHPQLTGLKLWAIAHLLVNGENRSVILFGALLAWGVLSVIGSNKRDGAWEKPEKQSILKDIITVALGIGVYVGFVMIHEWLIGVSPMPMAGA